ncbi:MAG: hypothetical protein QOI23_2450 [Chloroflexota bacterium]|nr:hypothetical protein [Chloroflexota bacterium]
MNRLIPAVAAAAFVLAACGASANTGSTSPSPGAGNAARNSASGQLVQINGQTLILTGANGDTTVTYTADTTFTKTSIASLGDIIRGTCILATGVKDAAGTVTATTVSISPKSATTGCAARNFVPSPGASPKPTPSPRPSTTPRPGGQANGTFVTGEVTAVSGISVTVLTQANESQKITVATAAVISKMATVSSTDLQTGECLRANGSRDAAGNVQATAITITPAGPSGTCTTGLGGRGPGGGGGFPGAGTGG